MSRFISRAFGFSVYSLAFLMVGCSGIGPKEHVSDDALPTALPSVRNLEEYLDYLILQRQVSVEIDGMRVDAPEIRALDTRIVRVAQAWARSQRMRIGEERAQALKIGLGPSNAKVVDLDEQLQKLETKLDAVKSAYSH